jgi:hypothetical protein
MDWYFLVLNQFEKCKVEAVEQGQAAALDVVHRAEQMLKHRLWPTLFSLQSKNILLTIYMGNIKLFLA